MPRWGRRVRIMIDWTVALFFRPDITKVDLAVEQTMHQRNCAAGASGVVGASAGPAAVGTFQPPGTTTTR
jgi:hypothetical protein